MRVAFGMLVVCAALGSSAAVVTENATLEGEYLKVVVSPNHGAVTEFGPRTPAGNYAAEGGLADEGFGVGNPYVPNRRVHEKLDTVENSVNPLALQYSYDCEGPNIKGLHVTRTMELMPNEASFRVQWTIENKGAEGQWVAPWVRNPIALGGKNSAGCRVDLPTLQGIKHVDRTGFFPASRNWIALTEPTDSVSLYGVFNADAVHSFLAVCDVDRRRYGFQTAFIPRLLNPGDTWETTYRLNAVRGLKHVDFASDEIAAQLDYTPGNLVVLLSTAKPLKGMQIHASVRAANGRVWKLPRKTFDIDPSIIVRSTYDWTAPGDGVYDFMAQLTRGKDEAFPLGKDTAPPHGGIDTQFVVGSTVKTSMEAWTDAPFALDRGPRTLKRAMACDGATAIWIEPSLEKIFREDKPEADGRLDATARVQLARNEWESFQVVVHPPKDLDLHSVNFTVKDLANASSGTQIDAANVRLSNVGYCPIRIPSYFEGATGDWPDALPPFKPFTATGDRCNPVWFSVYAPPKTPAGKYTGEVVMTSTENKPVRLTLEVTVYDFDLPPTPSLKTDFRYWPQQAADAAKAVKCTLGPQDLLARYVGNALEHRVTLAEAGAFPNPAAADYTRELKKFEPQLKDLAARGATTYPVPASLLEVPDQLRTANAFVVSNKLQGRAFCAMADQPIRPEWPKLTERMQLWHDAAPDIPVTVAAQGMQPFLPSVPSIWTVHTQMLDTANNQVILERIKQGQEVWWFVNHYPPRPYANFFVDFAGIEHRVLFWQTWALGIRGLYYWGVNYIEPGRNPYTGLVDVTPVNGDGFLVYPGADGPVNSIRWEIIRDGIEDYDYLTLLTDLVRKHQKAGTNAPLVEQAVKALNIKTVAPDLVSFSRDPKPLLAKRDEIAHLIVALGKLP